MLLQMLKSKLHNATVTDVEIDYEGSLTIDQDLMDTVKMRPYEKILVANITNGERFETYAIPAESGSRRICLNGATAHKGAVGNRLIIFSFAMIPENDVASHHPFVLVLGPGNESTSGLKEV